MFFFLISLHALAAPLGCINLLGSTIDHEVPGVSETLIRIANSIPVTVQSGAEVEIALSDALWELLRLSKSRNATLDKVLRDITALASDSIQKSHQLGPSEEESRWLILDFRDYLFRFAVASRFLVDKIYMDLPIAKRFGLRTLKTVELVIKNNQHWHWFASNINDYNELQNFSQRLKPHFLVTVHLMLDGLLIAQ